MATTENPVQGETTAPQETAETQETALPRPSRISLTGLLAKAPPLSAAFTAALLAAPTINGVRWGPGHGGNI